MSNIVTLKFTKFVDLDDRGNSCGAMFGYRVYDSYGSAYDNNFESFAELNEAITKETLLDTIKNHDAFRDICPDTCNHIEFNDEIVTWKELT